MKARQTQIRFNPLGIDFDCPVQFGEGFGLVVLREQNAAHQDMTFDVVAVFL